MYELVFVDKIVRCHSLASWQAKVIQLQSAGNNYHSFERTTFGWRFYF